MPTNRYYKVEIKTEYGDGIWVVEADSSGFSARQLEIYPDKVLKTPEDSNLFSYKMPEGLKGQPYEEISREEFDRFCERYVTPVCR